MSPVEPQPRPDTAGRRGAAIGLPILGAGSSSESSRVPLAGGAAPVVSFVSLGCAKNLVDSERMLGDLATSGVVLSGDEEFADTVVVNTCGFLENSRTEALEVLRGLAERKRRGELSRIVVAGCLVQRDGVRIKEWVPEVDALVGVNNRDDVVRAVWRLDRDAELNRYMGAYHPTALGDARRWNDLGRLRLTPPHYAYVRISEGCDQKCTFCTIPSIRGPMHCKTPDELIAEGRELIADGARELLLIGQDTTSYGHDIDYETGLARLLRTLDGAWEGADWIRLMYVYPSILSDEIIDAIAESRRVVKYIDIPLQHINDRVLKAMHRRVTRGQTEALLEKLRARIPDVTIRTTFIVGFPGETDAEFRELLEFVRSFGFDAAGAFPYSLEAETPSGRMKSQVDDDVKRARYEEFMLTQQEVAFAAARKWVGRTREILIDGADERGAVGRHAGQAPEVDASCILPDVDAEPGTLVSARCVGSDDYDLIFKPAKSGRARSSRRR